jgi:hypothetical protein
METGKKRTRIVLSVLVMCGLMVFSLLAIAGNLEPSAPPGPTMKTLGEVEPRVAVQSLVGDANSLYVISQPGSYYLTGNITGEPNKNCIRIEANNVTLDLMGYSIMGVPGSKSGVVICEILPIEEVPFTSTIRNGSICMMGTNGLEALVYIAHFSPAGSGEDGPTETEGIARLNLRLERLSVYDNGGHGVSYQNIEEFPHFGGNLQLRGVSVYNNGGHGVYVEDRQDVMVKLDGVELTGNGGSGMCIIAMMTNVDAYSTTTGHNGGNGMYLKAQGRSSVHLKDMSFVDNDANGLGIVGESHDLLEDVTFTHNALHGMIIVTSSGHMTDVDEYSSLSGFNGGSGIIINGRGNLDKCSAVGNGGVGIQLGAGSTITGGKSNDNESHGIQVSANCRVVGNTCEGNGKGAIGIQEPAGIFATGNGNRIEANHVVGNKVGIDVDGTDNLVIKNSAMGNSTKNYDVTAGNGVGPIIGTGDVDSSDNPHANYDF